MYFSELARKTAHGVFGPLGSLTSNSAVATKHGINVRDRARVKTPITYSYRCKKYTQYLDMLQCSEEDIPHLSARVDFFFPTRVERFRSNSRMHCNVEVWCVLLTPPRCTVRGGCSHGCLVRYSDLTFCNTAKRDIRDTRFLV